MDAHAQIPPSQVSSHSSQASSSSLGTYEATMAALSIQQQPDPIHWMNQVTFREQHYRLLHHQQGTTGIFTIRLLQAQQLRRSHWSPLALGPVKLLGLSKAHGPVSSFCEFALTFLPPEEVSMSSSSSSSSTSKSTSGGSSASTSNSCSSAASCSDSTMMDEDRKPAAVQVQGSTTTSMRTTSSSARKPIFTSPVIPNNDHPVWAEGDTACHFEFPLQKGAAHTNANAGNNHYSSNDQRGDGMRIVLTVTVREDATTLEQMIPSLPGLQSQSSHNHNSNNQHRMLGMGQIDLTELCFGEYSCTGQPCPSVQDAWIPLSLPRNTNNDPNCHEPQQPSTTARTTSAAAACAENHKVSSLQSDCSSTTQSLKTDPLAGSDTKQNSSDNNNTNDYGRVRVLISYQPVGLEPQPKDIVAFESFARHDVRNMSCRPVMDPLLPLTVLDRKGSYLLLEYVVQRHQHHRHHHHHHRAMVHQPTEKACVRVHRNAVFVIERQNIMDAATNLVLLPVDVAMSTPIGQATQRALSPIVTASRELLMPALLSAKLVWLATRTTGLGVAHGVIALTGTVWQEGTSSLTGGNNNNNSSGGGRGNLHRRHHSSENIHPRRHDRRSNATAHFVQL
jgi:hypothetical protein